MIGGTLSRHGEGSGDAVAARRGDGGSRFDSAVPSSQLEPGALGVSSRISTFCDLRGQFRIKHYSSALCKVKGIHSSTFLEDLCSLKNGFLGPWAYSLVVVASGAGGAWEFSSAGVFLFQLILRGVLLLHLLNLNFRSDSDQMRSIGLPADDLLCLVLLHCFCISGHSGPGSSLLPLHTISSTTRATYDSPAAGLDWTSIASGAVHTNATTLGGILQLVLDLLL